MYEIKIDRTTCKGCGACVKVSPILFLDETNLVNMKGGVIENESVEGFISNSYDVKNSASVCPNECIHIFDEDTGEEIEVERCALINTN